MSNQNAAILLFSRTAAAEAAAKPLSMGKRSAESVAGFMVNHIKKLTAKTQLPVFFFSEKQQHGDTFGERFANAFEDVFALGYEHVIAIGNDCLTVSTTDILLANETLKTTPSVLGATTDGGAYLIGLQQVAFQKNDFQNIHWQTDTVFDELIQYIDNQNLTIDFLSQKSDIDHVSDWKKTLETVTFSLKKILSQLLYFLMPIPSARNVYPINTAFLRGAIALRAPPHIQ